MEGFKKKKKKKRSKGKIMSNDKRGRSCLLFVLLVKNGNIEATSDSGEKLDNPRGKIVR